MKNLEKPRGDRALSIPTQEEAENALANMPVWVREMKTKEAMGTAVLETNQEMLLVVCDVLIRFFGFDDPKIFHNNVIRQWEEFSEPPKIEDFLKFMKPIMEGVAEYEEYGANIISPESVKQVANVVLKTAEVRLKKKLLEAGDKEYPLLPQLADLVSEIEGKPLPLLGEYETTRLVAAGKKSKTRKKN